MIKFKDILTESIIASLLDVPDDINQFDQINLMKVEKTLSILAKNKTSRKFNISTRIGDTYTVADFVDNLSNTEFSKFKSWLDTHSLSIQKGNNGSIKISAI